MTNRFARVFGRIVLVLAPAALVVASAATESNKAAATKGMVKRSDLEIVDCLLPGQVRARQCKLPVAAAADSNHIVREHD